MRIKVPLEGLLFTGDCQQGTFTRGEVRCATCEQPLEQQLNAGGAYLICPSANRGCIKPSKSYDDENAMRNWLESAWQAIAQKCTSGEVVP
jgi:hypothetical protein